MTGSTPSGQIVVLNGAPRSGKSSIAASIQERFEGLWMNLGVDVSRTTTPARFQPGIGLRPGEDEHHAAAVVPVLFAALYDSVAAHSRLGLNVVVDVGHHNPIPLPIRRWQHDVHAHGVYDLEVDTSLASPEQCADAIHQRIIIGPPPTAFEQLAAR